MLLKTILPILLICFSFAPANAQKLPREKPNVSADDLDNFYERAQAYFHAKHYSEALTFLKLYLEKSRGEQTDHTRIISSIDQIGRIYLREQRNPDAAIPFFKSLQDDPRLSEAEHDDIAGWLAAAEDWKSVGKFPEMTADPNKQYQLGERFFKSGMRKLKYPLDNAGNADFSIAQSYLLHFIIQNDADSRIGEALYMMGEIRRRLWNDKDYWAENFYFKEVIRRFPHTDLAWQAYQSLVDGVHFGYSGSGGDRTPPSVQKMLKNYKTLASPEPENSEIMRPEKKADYVDAGPEILVKFKQGVKDSQISAMSTDIGLRQIKEIKPLRLRVFQITSGQSVEDVIKACQKEPFVEYAEPNQTFKTKR